MTDKIRIRASGAIVSDNAFRIMHKDTSFPSVLDATVLNNFGADPVYDGLQPTLTNNQYAKYDGVEQINGKWFTKYTATDYTAQELADRLSQWRQSATCTPFQGRMALSDAGLLSQVETLIANPSADQKTKLAWEYAMEWRRLSPMLATLMAALNITDTQADDLFIAAKKISA